MFGFLRPGQEETVHQLAREPHPDPAAGYRVRVLVRRDQVVERAVQVWQGYVHTDSGYGQH